MQHLETLFWFSLESSVSSMGNFGDSPMGYTHEAIGAELRNILDNVLGSCGNDQLLVCYLKQNQFAVFPKKGPVPTLKVGTY